MWTIGLSEYVTKNQLIIVVRKLLIPTLRYKLLYRQPPPKKELYTNCAINIDHVTKTRLSSLRASVMHSSRLDQIVDY